MSKNEWKRKKKSASNEKKVKIVLFGFEDTKTAEVRNITKAGRNIFNHTGDKA